MNFTKKEESLLRYIRNTKFLQEHTKQIYINRLTKIKTDIYKQNIDYIILHPKMFTKKLDHFSKHSNEGRLNTSIGDHAKDGYISAIKALFIYNQTLKEKYKHIYDTWDSEHQKIRKPISSYYLETSKTYFCILFGKVENTFWFFIFSAIVGKMKTFVLTISFILGKVENLPSIYSLYTFWKSRRPICYVYFLGGKLKT